MSEKTKKGFKMPSSFSVLLIIIAIMAVLTWIIPAGQYDADKSGNLITGTYKTVAQNPQGIWLKIEDGCLLLKKVTKNY